MTTYILAGGNDRCFDNYGLLLAEKIRKTAPPCPKLLSCFFADPEPWQWKLRAKTWEQWFRKYLGEGLAYDYALPDTLIGQIEASDIVYLHGGDNNTLIVRLLAYAQLPAVFEDKIVVGSSAGANYLAKKFWIRSKRQVGHGAGVVPVNVMVHYGSKDGGSSDSPVDWSEANARMATAAGSEPITRISEGEFVVV